ncbi:hypothetical protein SeLEV6574_g03707 [Synchytrium endobioticum]|uniref:Uncharacterized protein n=1 Tax=Synchytrium endobioticum TaxID=286115 RepID=A0A507D333_9FUNG|nr:hypothetical protein SeLEV6574_g03707 [Synchytrium endobioticum]
MSARYLLQLWSSISRVTHQSSKMKINIIGCLLLSASLFLSLVVGLPTGNQGDNVQNVEAEQTPVHPFENWLNQRGWKLEYPKIGPLQAANDASIKYLKTQLARAEDLFKKLRKDKWTGVTREETTVLSHFVNYFRDVKGFPSAAVLEAMEKNGLAIKYASLAVDHCRLMIKVIDHWKVRVGILVSDPALKDAMIARTTLRQDMCPRLIRILEDVKSSKRTVAEAILDIASLNTDYEHADYMFIQSLTRNQQGPRLESIPNRAEHDRPTTTPSTSMPSMGYGPSSSTGSASRLSGGRRSGRGSRRVSK